MFPLPLMSQLDRRSVLKVGFGGLAALAGATHGNAANPKAKAKTIIFLHQWGGPSHHDTIDPKPDAPDNIRGELGVLQTKVPGALVSDLLPRTSKIIDRLCQIRGLHHTMANHNSAGYYSLTGIAPATDDQRLRDSRDLFPGYGAIADKFAPTAAGIPGFVSFPHTIADGSITPGQHASFLGKRHDPLFVGPDPGCLNWHCLRVSPRSGWPDEARPGELLNGNLANWKTPLWPGAWGNSTTARTRCWPVPRFGKLLTCRGSPMLFGTGMGVPPMVKAACWHGGLQRRGAGGFRCICTRALAGPRGVGTRTVFAVKRCIRF